MTDRSKPCPSFQILCRQPIVDEADRIPMPLQFASPTGKVKAGDEVPHAQLEKVASRPPFRAWERILPLASESNLVSLSKNERAQTISII